MTSKGSFLPYYLPYRTPSGQGISEQSQAETLLKEAQKLVAAGAAGVAITYSANYGQTVHITATYQAGNWNPQVGGVNQAQVMADMLSLLGTTYSALQMKMRIAPITTMSYPPDDYGSYTHAQVVDQDLAAIKSLLDSGWTVLGWQNNSTATQSFAVGGGVSKKPGPNGKPQFPPALSDLVQKRLQQFAVDYP